MFAGQPPLPDQLNSLVRCVCYGRLPSSPNRMNVHMYAGHPPLLGWLNTDMYMCATYAGHSG